MLPREKFRLTGVESLTLSELIALVLGYGTRNKSVFKLALEISKVLQDSFLFSENSRYKVYRSLLARLGQIGLGPVQYMRLAAVVELANRISLGRLGIKIRKPADAAKLASFLSTKKKEYVYGFYLDINNILLARRQLFIGGLESVSLHVPTIFRPALSIGAYGIILVHNHPSGQCKPSQLDMKATHILKEAGELLQIKLLDHLIIGKGCYFSFKNIVL